MVTGSWVTADYSGENQRGDPLQCKCAPSEACYRTLANYVVNSVEKIQCFWIRGWTYRLVSVGPVFVPTQNWVSNCTVPRGVMIH
jgi:hypothetical protein